jgi:hypothetical protein
MNKSANTVASGGQTLAQRLGITAPESPLRWKLIRLTERFPSPSAVNVESWLVDVANSRGARVMRRQELPGDFTVPESELSNEELVVALMLPCLADEPPMLRLAAQLISRGLVDGTQLLVVARREGVLRVLANLAAQALRVAPDHQLWRHIGDATAQERPLPENVIHWTRLAEPVMPHRGVHDGKWRLVA